MRITSVSIEPFDCGRQIGVCVGTDSGVRHAVAFHIGESVSVADFSTLMHGAVDAIADWCEAQELNAPLAGRY